MNTLKPKIHQIENLSALPVRLKPMMLERRWVPWKLLRKAGGWTKQPWDGAPISWGVDGQAYTYADACGSVARGDADGIGFILCEEAHWAAIDIDHCAHPEGGIWPWALQIVEHAVKSCLYVEQTVGGEGLRIIGTTVRERAIPRMIRKGDITPDGGIEVVARPAKGAAGFEIYCRPKNRFITISGLIVGDGNPIMNIDWTLEYLDSLYPAAREPLPLEVSLADISYGRAMADVEPEAIPRDLKKLIDGPLSDWQLANLDKSAEFQSAVWRLANLNYSAVEILQIFEPRTEGIAQRYIAENRLQKMIELSFRKKVVEDRRTAMMLAQIDARPPSRR